MLTQPGDADELAEALRRLGGDAELREALGSEAIRRSMEFTPERTAERILAVYREVLST
jgi:glycosyltransferase involved in cell wall biosynthesis